MSDRSPPQAGVGAGSTVTTSLIGVFTSMIPLLPDDLQESSRLIIPYICPFLGWAMIWIYNRYAVPPGMASVEGKLKRDIKQLKECLNDRNLSDEEKASFKDDYIETKKKLARLGRDYSDGVYSRANEST
ncbi:hypothetical protein [Proteus mirabilis]|uniref:Uncharacterized protein n=1 Tax=Proteus mirabilis TaxID=584 RepID=A0A7D5W9A3_PROMI|nr:hypothetical protein [Proteus mirabilis]MBA7799754.1 hypothetical protein [Citrobacter sp. RHBSTW-01065]ATC78643.1 hypothetical protein BG029_09400 [Proteus mirabilis]EJD6334696.1 hypothetical protein [Proteus mirabilis]EJD6351186.1 hypothetical protein [Proteus mirabilis]EJD6359875.1 hypothetical protein [Proteus mirabilis]